MEDRGWRSERERERERERVEWARIQCNTTDQLERERTIFQCPFATVTLFSHERTQVRSGRREKKRKSPTGHHGPWTTQNIENSQSVWAITVDLSFVARKKWPQLRLHKSLKKREKEMVGHFMLILVVWLNEWIDYGLATNCRLVHETEWRFILVCMSSSE